MHLAFEIVREQRLLVVAYHKSSEHSRADDVAFAMMFDAARRLSEIAVGEGGGGEPEPAELACLSFRRSILELRQELHATPRVEWSRQLLMLACALEEAVLALGANDLPLEAALEMGCEGARMKLDRRNVILLANIDRALADTFPGSVSHEA